MNGHSADPPVLEGRRLRLRPMTVDDVPTLVCLRNESRHAFFSDRPVDVDSTRRWLAASRERGELNWVIELSTEIIGTVSAIPGPRGTEIGRLIIARERRRRGYMSEALSLVLPYVAAFCPRPIFLEVKPDNVGAIRLYEQLGFHATRLRMDWDDSALSPVRFAS